MSKRTVGLIVALLAITIVLLAAALANISQPNSTGTVERALPAPTPYAQSVLTFSPSEINVLPGSSAPQTVNVMLSSGSNNVTGVQLELSYQPTAFTSIAVANGSLFPNPFVIVPAKVDAQEGTISYAYAITPAQQSHKGSGIVATLTFTPSFNPVDSTGKRVTQTVIKFLPKSVISAQGLDQSVLNKTSLHNSLIIHFGTAASASPSAVKK